MANSSEYEIAINIAGKLEKSFTSTFKSASSAMKGLTKIVATTGTALTGMAAWAIKAGIDFESAFTGVRKTVDATDEQLAQLEDSILNMSKNMPESASGIAAVAEAAGQLGIHTENIEGFTKSMVELGDATNMTSEDAATSFARFANITGMSQDNFDRLGSVVVALGNNLATTESEITEMAMRIAGAGTQVGMTQAQIMSFSGALSSVGIEAEAGGTAFSTLISKMQLATETGGESLENFANVAGVSSEQFKQSFKEDATGAIMTFVEGLGKADEKGTSAIKTLNDMGITEVRMRDALLRASSASDVFTQALELGNKAWDDNTALANEANTRYSTMESQLKMLKNSVNVLGIEFYKSINNPMADIVSNAKGMVEQLDQAFNEGGFEGLTASLGTVFAEIATGIADYAPSIIDASVSVIESFVKGIDENIGIISESASKIVEGLAKSIVELMPTLLNIGVDILSGIGKGISEGLANAFPGVEDIFNPIKDGFQWIVDNSEGVIASLVSIGVAMAVFEVATSIVTFVDIIKNGEVAVKALAKAQGALNIIMGINPFVLIAAAIAGLVAGIIYLWSTNEGFRNAVISAWQSISNSANDIWNSICSFFTDTIPNAMNALIDFVTNNWQNLLLLIVNPFAGAFALLYSNCDGFKTFIDSFIQAICLFFTEKIPEAITTVITWFSQLPNNIAYGLGAAVGAVANWVIECYNYLTTNVPMWIENIGNWFANLPNAIWQWLMQTIINIGLWGSEMFNSASTWASNTITSIGTWFSQLPSNIWSWLTKVLTNITTWGSEMFSSATESVSTVCTGIVEGFISLPDKMIEIGTNIVNGIRNGIKNAWDSMTGWIGGLCESFIVGVKSEFEIHSPSKKMRDQVGKWIPLGISEGLESTTGDLLKTATDMCSNLSDAIKIDDTEVGVNWNAKGGVFNSPTILGTNKGLQGVGEVGEEVILPLNLLWNKINDIISTALNKYSQVEIPSVYNLKIDTDRIMPLMHEVNNITNASNTKYYSNIRNETNNSDTNNMNYITNSSNVNKNIINTVNNETRLSLDSIVGKIAEAILPLNFLWDKMNDIISDLIFDNSNGIDFDSLLNKLDGNSKSNNNENYEYEPTIQYSPVYKFYGAAPSKEDLMQASRMSQDEFDRMMKKWQKDNGRFKFA
ncbi:phage tail tape measure protein [Clostridium butyricum]|uniref:phage tail tape measure protein n=1 Tax=Clostridium butyricum TaxID=1492 RepID=UPI003D32DB6A